MPSDFIFIAASYLEMVGADADHESVRRTEPEFPGLDCVTIGRKASGEIRFGREPDPQERPERSPLFLAAGLASALFPSLGGDIPASRMQEREMYGAVSGVIIDSLGRVGLLDFAALLDPFAAGLIVVTTLPNERRVQSALTNAQSSISRSVSLDTDVIEQQFRAIRARHRSPTKS